MNESEKATPEFKVAFEKFMETKENTRTNTEATKALLVEVEKSR